MFVAFELVVFTIGLSIKADSTIRKMNDEGSESKSIMIIWLCTLYFVCHHDNKTFSNGSWIVLLFISLVHDENHDVEVRRRRCSSILHFVRVPVNAYRNFRIMTSYTRDNHHHPPT